MNMNLNSDYKEQKWTVMLWKSRGLIQDWKCNDSSLRIWVKDDGQWLEYWSADAILDHAPANLDCVS